MMKKHLSVIVCCFLLGGCATSLDQNAGKIGGTAAGVGLGAVIGKQVAGEKGMYIGAALGGILGYAIGDSIDKRRDELRKIAEKEQMEMTFADIQTSDLMIATDMPKNNIDMQKSSSTQAQDKKIGDQVIITEQNQFDKGSSELTPKAKESFAKVATTYKQAEKKILIIGHTDDSGNSALNQKLSEERAKNLGKLFSENGVKKENIYFLGAGETLPIANNNTQEGATKNRRVEIVELNSEEEIGIYASMKTSNPKFFRPVQTEKVALAKTSETKKEASKNSTTTVVSKKEESQSSQKQTIVADIKNFVDFGGNKSKSNSIVNATNFGELVQKESFIGIGTKAKADDAQMNIYGNCTLDKPRVGGETKSLASGEKLTYKTSEYKRGLNETSWTTMLNGHLVGVAPIGVLRSGSKAVSSPNVLVYKNYMQGSNVEPSETLTTTVNTYQGSSGLLYRVFVNNHDSIRCMDVVFNEKNVNQSIGKVYYVAQDGVYEKEFSIKEVGRN